MSLQVWLPLNGDLHNQGLDGSVVIENISSTGFTNSGKIGQALSITTDGQGANLKSYMNTCSKYTSYSICAWIYMNSTATNHSSSILSSGNWNAGASQCCFGLYNYSNGYNGILFPNKSSWNSAIYISEKITLNKWWHICITYDGSTTKAYVNGNYVGSSSLGGITSTSENSNLFVGRATYYDGFTLHGYINDLRIYDHCLSAKEVKEISKGLVLHYPLNDPYLESTTNLYSSWSGTCYNDSTGKYSYGTSTDMYYDTLENDIIKVRMGTSGQAAWPFVFFSGLTPPSNGEYRSLSFDYYPTIMDYINFYSYNTSGSINWISNDILGSGGDIPVITNRWNHISVIIKNTGSTNDGFGYMRIGTVGHTSDTSNYWLFKNIQLESKDHSTGYEYKNSSRTGNICYDVSGYSYNGTTTDSTCPKLTFGSPRYRNCYFFDSTAKNIITTNDSFSGVNNCSISFWCKVQTKGSAGWLPFTGQSGSYYIMAWNNSGNFYHNNIGSNTLKIYIDTLEKTSPQISDSVNSVTDKQWHHYVITGVNLSSWTKFTINNYSSSWNSICYYSDIRIYSTILSAQDIKELYENSASIDKTHKFHSFEFYENNNSIVIDYNDVDKSYVYGNTIRGSFWAGSLISNSTIKSKLKPSTTYYTRCFVKRNNYPNSSRTFTQQAWHQVLLYDSANSISIPVISQSKEKFVSMDLNDVLEIRGQFSTPSDFKNASMLFYSSRYSGSSSDWASNGEVLSSDFINFQISKTPFVNKSTVNKNGVVESSSFISLNKEKSRILKTCYTANDFIEY